MLPIELVLGHSMPGFRSTRMARSLRGPRLGIALRAWTSQFSTSGGIACGFECGPPGLLLDRSHVMVCVAESLHPRVAGRRAHSVLAAELCHVDRTALRVVPAPLPFQYQIHLLLHRVRRFPGHRQVSATSLCNGGAV